MESLFINVLNMSLTAGFVILAVIGVRLLLRRLPRIFSYVLWSAVLFRLLCPFSFPGALSLASILDAPASSQGRIPYIPDNIGYMANPPDHASRRRTLPNRQQPPACCRPGELSQSHAAFALCRLHPVDHRNGSHAPFQPLFLLAASKKP